MECRWWCCTNFQLGGALIANGVVGRCAATLGYTKLHNHSGAEQCVPYTGKAVQIFI